MAKKLARAHGLPTEPWLAPAVGAACFILGAGWLDLLGWATPIPLVTITAGGIILWMAKCGETTSPFENLDWGRPEKTILACGTLVALMVCHARQCGAWDDTSGYFPVCREMLAHGSSWAPMSLRRALTWGGQFPLQGRGMLGTGDTGGRVYDPAVPILILTAMALNLPTEGWKKTLTGCALILLPLTSTNSAPAALVCVLLAGAWQTRKNRPLMILCVAAATALRTQSIGFTAVFLAAELLENTRSKGPKAALKAAALWAAALAGLWAPFAIMQMAQFGTPCTLVWPGKVNPEYLDLGGTWSEGMLMLGSLVAIAPVPIVMLAMGLRKECTRSICAAALVTVAAGTFMLTDLPTDFVGRYLWPYAASGLICTVLSTPNRTAPWMLAVLAWPLLSFSSNFVTDREAYAAKAEKTDAAEAEEIQKRLPEGAKIALLAVWVNLFDPSKHKILNLDVIQAVGQVPGGSGSKEDWKKWARAADIDYLIDDKRQETPTQRVKKHFKEIWLKDRLKWAETMKEAEKWFPSKQMGPFRIIDLREGI